jgi:hypothetical protein
VEYLVGDLLEGYVRRSAHVTVGVCLAVCKTGGIDGALLARGVVRENHVCRSLRSDDTPIDMMDQSAAAQRSRRRRHRPAACVPPPRMSSRDSRGERSERARAKAMCTQWAGGTSS